MLARFQSRRSAFAALTVAALCLVAGYYLFSSAVLIESACSLAKDRTCVEVAHRRVWVAFEMGGVFVVITGLVVASFARRAWRSPRR